VSGGRVLHVIHSSAFGGGPNMLTILCTQLAAEFDMEVVCDGLGDMPARVKAAGTVVHLMPLATKWSFAAHIPRLASLIREREPDIVHLHGQFAGSLSQPALRVAGRWRVVYTAQWPSYLDDGGAWSRLRNRTAERVSCGGSDVVVAVSDNDRREFEARALCDPKRLRVIHNAYFLSDASPRRVAPATPVVGFVGRLADQKGCEFLLRAAPEVLKARPDARFLIVGDGPERPRLEAMARDLQLAAAVEFAGYDPAPATRMRGMTVLAVPSVYEPLGMVTLEAMALGVPVVGSAVGGIPEAVEAGVTGLLVPPRDAHALAVALGEVLAGPELAARFGSAGSERARRLFSPEVIAAKYADLYRGLLKTSS
jgi:glycosyltransferase involved in cell wall biosynthesis